MAGGTVVVEVSAGPARYTADLADPACLDPREVGGKAAGLAALAADGLPVAPGFAVGAAAFRDFLDAAGASGAGAGDLADRLAATPVPAAVEAEIRREYAALCARAGVSDLPVAIRSSATAEDAAGASFAGGYDTWLDVSGADAVVEHVHRCWTAVLGDRAVEYARAGGIDPATVEMAVVVQQTVRARAAGVMFTISPVTGDRSRIVVEASWGLGVAVVGGEVTPDRWVVDKIALTIVSRTPGDKRVAYRRGGLAVAVDADRRTELCLTDEQVLELARTGKQVERERGGAQDLEFAVGADRQIVLLQCRPETVWSARVPAPRFDPGAGVTSWISGAVSGLAGAAPAGHHHHADAA
jgi:pyruvate,water dikinase